MKLRMNVFDQPNLSNYLREVEQCVENNHSPSHKYNDHWNNNLPPLSPTTNWSTNTTSVGNSLLESPHKQGFSPVLNSTSFISSSIVHTEKKWSAIVRQKIFELEGPNFCYKALFSDPPAPEVS
ncbi:hypothetical protein NQ314_013541 [Rhamnusium bicolor]|uniref:Uncharacterized protein n=1 Tax=Rhamnusium bicolor TaxID=1586634 RepID=A0AAV8X6C2_9CUCU|nr:hypothetical protein NQ314_013541 [Rhamnusium bicolor]